MNVRTAALATLLSLTSSLALAQAGGGNAAGAAMPESSGTAVNGNGGAVGTVNGRMTREGTTGMSQPNAASGPTTDGGGRDMSRPGGEGVSRKPAD